MKKGRIGLIDLDSKLPNIALMQVSGYYKSYGIQAEFYSPYEKYDKIYLSCVFSKNRKLALSYKENIENIEIGGTGVDIYSKLPDEFNKAQLDYDLYNIDYGIGFTRRGCINKCKFCVVPKKEQWQEDKNISELVNPKSNKLHLLDNNFTVDPNMIDKCKELHARNIETRFYGLDARNMTCEKSYHLSKVVGRNQINIAFDNINQETCVHAGVENLSKHIIPHQITCYILVGYDTTLEEDMYRFELVKSWGIRPYIMPYQDLENPKPIKTELKQLARWSNAHIHKKCSFENYKPRAKALKQYETQTSLF